MRIIISELQLESLLNTSIAKNGGIMKRDAEDVEIIFHDHTDVTFVVKGFHGHRSQKLFGGIEYESPVSNPNAADGHDAVG